MKFPIVINKFRLGDRSERIAALADEWGCSVTVVTTRLLDAGLAAVDREQRMTPVAIRAAFELQTKGGGSGWDDIGPVRVGIMSDANDAVDALLGPWTCIEPKWPSLPDTAGKRMFDEAARHSIDGARELTAEEVQAAILNGMPLAIVGGFGASHQIGSWGPALPGANDELCADEACPGCGCLPGDGVTDGCDHPDGCGFYEGDATE